MSLPYRSHIALRVLSIVAQPLRVAVEDLHEVEVVLPHSENDDGEREHRCVA